MILLYYDCNDISIARGSTLARRRLRRRSRVLALRRQLRAAEVQQRSERRVGRDGGPRLLHMVGPQDSRVVEMDRPAHRHQTETESVGAP